MSWFDTTGLANLAKTALKEAQKQIDKALDIKDDDLKELGNNSETKSAITTATMTSKTAPSTPTTDLNKLQTTNLSVWGSFTGSFFENPIQENLATVTTPPISLNKIDEDIQQQQTDKDNLIENRLSALSSESESLEILSNPTTPGSNLQSPNQLSLSTILGGSESVEILGFETPTTTTATTSEIFSSSNSINSPFSPTEPDITESVEIISEELSINNNYNYNYNDDDNISLEEEDDSISYNTISDTTTTVVTVVEPTTSTSSSNIIEYLPITTAPSRSSLHLSLSTTTATSSIINSDKINLIKSMNISEESNCDTEESNESDHTIGSSTHDKNVGGIGIVGGGGHVFNMLEDAMMEKSIETQLSDSTQSFEDVQTNLLTSYQSDIIEQQEQQQSENQDQLQQLQQIDNDSYKMDLIKINSGQTSGHTSGDELETTTSSDIEIISSPNGDSSSTNSAYRTSPKQLNIKNRNFELLGGNNGGNGNNNSCHSSKKGHCRESSEVSIKSDDSSQTENEKLMRRISELTDIIETREYKLVELSRHNIELQEKYTDVLYQMDTKQKGTHNLELTNVTEEYTQRLSALEKKFQQSIRERDHLRKQLDTIKIEITTRINKEQVDKMLNDKEYIIIELRTEGEKLSKQVLQHSNIIKKLRIKEKENEQTLKRQKEQIEELTDETERLKKTLSAKDDVERSQIEAVHKLSSDKRKLEKDNLQLRSQLDDLTQKLETIQKSFDAAKKELTDKKQTYSELTRKTEALAIMETETKLVQNQKEQMLSQMDELREKIRQSEIGYTTRELKLRQENIDLIRRLEEAEVRMEEQAQDVTKATIPLVKQLESLQTSFNVRTFAWDKREKNLMDELDDAQKRLVSLNDFEQNSKEQVLHLNSRVGNLEERLSVALLKSEQMNSLLQQKEMEYDLMEIDYKKEVEELTRHKRDYENTKEKNEMKIKVLEEQLKREKEKLILEKQKMLNYQKEKAIAETSDSVETSTIHGDQKRESMGSSPTLSLGRISFSESQGSAAWNLDDFDYLSHTRAAGPDSVYGSNSFVPIGHTSFLETLQATVKQRDGELHQLQWELSRLQTERNFLTNEISNLTMELDTIKEKLETVQTIEDQFKEVQQQYDALLQMYGEKVEEFQELRLDLQDVKEMYKGQIDELLRQQKLSNIQQPQS